MEKAKDEKLKWDTPMLVRLGGSGSSAAVTGTPIEYDCESGSAAEACCNGATASTVCAVHAR